MKFIFAIVSLMYHIPRLWYLRFRAWLVLRKLKRMEAQMQHEIAIMKDVVRASKRRRRRIAKLERFMPDSYKPSHWKSYV